jgi:hypothetical protein
MPSPKNADATLQVNTKALYDAIHGSQPINIDNYCKFKENTPGTSNENFSISVNAGDTITWTGEPFGEGSGGEINIVAIIYEKGHEVFSEIDFTRDNGKKNKPMKAKGSIEQSLPSGYKNDNESYTLYFSYTDGPGNYFGTYNIDPKIEVNP